MSFVNAAMLTDSAALSLWRGWVSGIWESFEGTQVRTSFGVQESTVHIRSRFARLREEG